jgi:hypothetical protein
MLRGLGLELASNLDPWHQRRVHADRLSATEVIPKLPERLDKGKALDVANGTADLADDKVQAIDVRQRELLDGIGDVRMTCTVAPR